ncbi:MAG: discoidin domain-containing protein, partial [Tannerellaceae bacterium]|nr:discoidin domain-containing protein [Tannerellaceae bacterium]
MTQLNLIKMKMKNEKYIVAIIGIISFICLRSNTIQAINKFDIEKESFLNPPRETRPFVFMWWYDNVHKEAITEHLEELNDKGVGGVIVFYHGGMPGVPFLSETWLELYRHTVKECARLNLECGANVCSGWPSGGPWIQPVNAAQRVASSETILEGPSQFSGKLNNPPGVTEFYQDEAVYAYPVRESVSPQPVISVSSNAADIGKMLDGDYNTAWQPADDQQEAWILFDYKTPEKVNFVYFEREGATILESSDDGITFQPVDTLHSNIYTNTYQSVPERTARFFRLVLKKGGTEAVRMVSLGTEGEVHRNALFNAKRGLMNPRTPIGTSRLREEQVFPLEPLYATPGDVPLRQKEAVDLTDKISADGTLNWKVPAGKWKVIRVGSAFLKINVGGGMLPDYLSKEAANFDFDNSSGVLIREAGKDAGSTFKYLHEDNVEINGIYSWTKNMREEFIKRRGYDPKPYLAAMAGEIVENIEITDRFLNDVRRTVADCVADGHYATWATRAHEKGVMVRAEGGGQHHPRLMMNDGLKNLGRLDIPVGEFWYTSHWSENQWIQEDHHRNGLTEEWFEGRQNVNLKQAASASHLYGKNRTATEAFTSFTHWQSTPATLLPSANVAFCEGVNDITFHGSATSGIENGYPGVVFYAGVHFNNRITWWNQAKSFTDYLARCQYMLRRGRFVADVLYYQGDLIPCFIPPKYIDPDRGFGYDYDACNTEIILERLSVENGRIVLPDGMSYRVLVLPESGIVPIEVARRILELVKQGATVIGPRFTGTPGLKGYPKSEQALREITEELWGKSDGVVDRKVGKGRIICGKGVAEVLKNLSVERDFAYLSEKQISDYGIMPVKIDFIHRQDGQSEIYFLINRRNTTETIDARFRVSGKLPEFWNPVNGSVTPANAFSMDGSTTTVPIKLVPHQGIFVVFREPTTLTRQDGANYLHTVIAKTLNGPWELYFDPKWRGPVEPVIYQQLQDLTQSDVPEIKYYAGTVKYRKEFDLQGVDKGRLFLDLGKVHEIASIKLNGHDLGTVWCAPWMLDITSFCKPDGNILEIKVTNTWWNRLVYEASLP